MAALLDEDLHSRTAIALWSAVRISGRPWQDVEMKKRKGTNRVPEKMPDISFANLKAQVREL